MDTLPKIDLNSNTATQTAKKAASQAKSSLKAAGSLVFKQAERTKLMTVTLPCAYAELGKSIYENSSRRNAFPGLFHSLDNLFAERKRIAHAGKVRPAGANVAEKAKYVAADVANIAKTKAIDVQTFQAFAKLGQAVFQQNGSSAGAFAVVEPITKAIARCNQLDQEMAAINSSAKGGWITPKRIVWAAGILVGLVVFGNLADVEIFSRSRATQSDTTVTEQATAVAVENDAGDLSPVDRQGWEGYAANLRLKIEQSEEQLEKYAKDAKTAQAELDAGRKPDEDESYWESRRDARRARIDNYANSKTHHEELVQTYLRYTEEVRQENKQAAIAAKRMQETGKKQEREQEEAGKRVAEKRKSRRVPTMNPPKDPRGLEEYKEGWEDGVTLGYQWIDRVEQAAKGKSVEQHIKEHPLAKADAEEQLQSLTNEVLSRVNQMTQVIQNQRNRGITIDLDHPDATAAHNRWTFARGKQEGYSAVVFPVIYPMNEGK